MKIKSLLILILFSSLPICFAARPVAPAGHPGRGGSHPAPIAHISGGGRAAVAHIGGAHAPVMHIGRGARHANVGSFSRIRGIPHSGFHTHAFRRENHRLQTTRSIGTGLAVAGAHHGWARWNEGRHHHRFHDGGFVGSPSYNYYPYNWYNYFDYPYYLDDSYYNNYGYDNDDYIDPFLAMLIWILANQGYYY